jgi:hypothetical protein
MLSIVAVIAEKHWEWSNGLDFKFYTLIKVKQTPFNPPVFFIRYILVSPLIRMS